MEVIFLYGPPGVGKTTIGRRLADNLNLPFTDLDAEIETRAGASIPEIFADEGEAGFRKRESQLLEEVIASGPQVVALGGGTLLDFHNRACVEAAGHVVCLEATPEILAKRLKEATSLRPLLANPTSGGLTTLLSRRAKHYASFPIRLDISNLDHEQTAWEIQVKLGQFHVRGMDANLEDRNLVGSSLAAPRPGGYDVRIQPGGMDYLGETLQARGFKSVLVLVSDENVAPLHAPRVIESLHRSGFTVQQVTIPAGEAHKTMNTVSQLWEVFLKAGLERGSAVIALGGGAVGDVAGFAAATYLRGVHLVMLPSSLLAMVDASLGGKTGVNLPQGKNLVGAFHPPCLVLADPELLSTLPETELRSGMAELVKHAIIGDPELLTICAQGWGKLEGNWALSISRAMAVKIKIIQEDPYEAGRRAVLNLGHTVGHAVELCSGYTIRHGEAVAIGLVAEARLAEILGVAHNSLAEEIASILSGLGLPTQIPPEIDRATLVQAMGVDKKRAGGVVHLTLPVRVGEVTHGVAITNLMNLINVV